MGFHPNYYWKLYNLNCVQNATVFKLSLDEGVVSLERQNQTAYYS